MDGSCVRRREQSSVRAVRLALDLSSSPLPGSTRQSSSGRTRRLPLDARVGPAHGGGGSRVAPSAVSRSPVRGVRDRSGYRPWFGTAPVPPNGGPGNGWAGLRTEGRMGVAAAGTVDGPGGELRGGRVVCTSSGALVRRGSAFALDLSSSPLPGSTRQSSFRRTRWLPLDARVRPAHGGRGRMSRDHSRFPEPR